MKLNLRTILSVTVTLGIIPISIIQGKEDKEIYVYESVKEVALAKEEIVTYCTAFIAEKFVSAKSVIELNDKDIGKIVGDITLMDHQAKFMQAFKGINGRITLDAKEGKFRFRMTNIVATDKNGVKASWGSFEGANRYRIEPMTIRILDRFVEELKTYLNNVKKSDDW